MFEDIYDYCDAQNLAIDADSRSGRLPDGNQLPAWRRAGPWPTRCSVQAHGARGGHPPQYVTPPSWRKPMENAGLGHAHPHEPERPANRQNVFSNPDGSPASGRFCTPSAACKIPAAGDCPILFAPFVNSYRRLVRFNAAPINVQWGYDNRTCGIRASTPSPKPAALKTVCQAWTATRISPWPPPWPAPTWA